MAPIFFAFWFFAKNEEFQAIFREKRKKILPNRYLAILPLHLEYFIISNLRGILVYYKHHWDVRKLKIPIFIRNKIPIFHLKK